MFPFGRIPFNFPFLKKDGSISTIGDEINAGGGGGYVLPTASAETKGGVKIGTGLTMTGEVLSNNNPTPYALPTASAETKGGVKVGSGLTMDGEILNNSNPTPYSLPTASSEVLGGVKVGSGLSITDGVLSTTGGSSGGMTLTPIDLTSHNGTAFDVLNVDLTGHDGFAFAIDANDTSGEFVKLNFLIVGSKNAGEYYNGEIFGMLPVNSGFPTFVYRQVSYGVETHKLQISATSLLQFSNNAYPTTTTSGIGRIDGIYFVDF